METEPRLPIITCLVANAYSIHHYHPSSSISRAKGPLGFHAFILVLGEDKKAVGQLKVRVEGLLAGETLDWRLWHRSFTNASGRRFLNDISARTKAHIGVDLKSKILKLYADRDIKQTIIDLVKAQIARLKLLEWSIPIPPSTTEFFIRRGLPTLKEELGEDAAALELHPTPRLIIRGGEEAHKTVDRLIEESLSGIKYEAYDGEKVTCPSCFGKASSPVLLSCGHLYCAGCLRHFLSSAAEGKKFPLVCFGNEARCGAPIAIPVIRRFLIEKQPTKFKYCATPGCMQPYRCREDSRTSTCPSCFAAVCSSCHKEAHDGMTCRERRIMDNPEEQERLNEEWARGAGAKSCPSCRIWIQKTEGCNHVTCQCGAHICWNCLATFSKAQDVYNHLRTMHGGIHANDVQPARHLVPRTIVNQDARGWQWVELGHRDDLNFACEEDGLVQDDQAGRQPQPARGWRRLRRLMQPVFQ
ncbi:hypothetical protein M378DRAFT_170342 [Amanita muscaria Koide BX008]|uniref:RING-type domain-containing protein n=1 Tax=Amanita muscaria (strain Koide BX008) TaxID=946122 RepID=A0A0C2S7E0_AMAMK|nr:hypothetical protein M378DRAFT_170342 [Amanita muscaria Koide BX008]